MDIILTGSVAYDYLMTFPGYFRDHLLPDKLEHISLSLLVDSMVRLRGGISPNIAYTLALLGERPRVMATVGEDFALYSHRIPSLFFFLGAGEKGQLHSPQFSVDEKIFLYGPRLFSSAAIELLQNFPLKKEKNK